MAEQANPEWVSVPLVGWSHAAALAALAPRIDVHLVTHVVNRPAIERSPWPRDRVTFVSLGRFDRVFNWLIKHVFKQQFGTVALTATRIPFYWLFERYAWQLLRGRLERGDFDVVHRITPVSPVISSPMVRRCRKLGVPFVLGPINGGLPWPKGYDAASGKEREWLTRFRGLYRWLPYARDTYAHADAVVVASHNTLKQVRGDTPEARLHYLPENGIAAARVLPQPRGRPHLPLKVVFLGRLVPYKCADVVLRASAELIRAGKLTLTIIGDGPERGFLEAIIRDEQLASGVTMSGWLDHAAAMDVLATHDVLAFPSIREFGGGVVVEAMALGLVPVVMNYGGPGEIVTDDSGFRLALSSATQTTADLRHVLEQLVAAPERLAPLSAAARRRILDTFTWEEKARRSVAIYERVLARPPVS